VKVAETPLAINRDSLNTTGILLATKWNTLKASENPLAANKNPLKTIGNPLATE
jgi:hypothetical protein